MLIFQFRSTVPAKKNMPLYFIYIIDANVIHLQYVMVVYSKDLLSVSTYIQLNLLWLDHISVYMKTAVLYDKQISLILLILI